MKSRLHHVCIGVDDFDWYFKFFTKCLNMSVQREEGEAPNRNLWFDQGIQIFEIADAMDAGTSVHHVAIGVEDVQRALKIALEHGCREVQGNPEWFSLPNGIKIELKPY